MLAKQCNAEKILVSQVFCSSEQVAFKDFFWSQEGAASFSIKTKDLKNENIFYIVFPTFVRKNCEVCILQLLFAVLPTSYLSININIFWHLAPINMVKATTSSHDDCFSLIKASQKHNFLQTTCSQFVNQSESKSTSFQTVPFFQRGSAHFRAYNPKEETVNVSSKRNLKIWKDVTLIKIDFVWKRTSKKVVTI